MKKSIADYLLWFGLVLFITGCGGKEEAVSVISAPEEQTEFRKENEADTEADKDRGAEKENRGGICVYVCGAVAKEGICILPEGARIYEAVESAGGFLPDADGSAVNMARLLQDEDMVRIPFLGEASGMDDSETGGVQIETSDPRININTASEQELTGIPGIGKTRAAAIAAYRKKQGEFRKPEDLMQVPGIKQGTFEKIEEYIRIR